MSNKKEEVGELAITLSFDSKNADKQISTLNKSINRSEKEFKNAAKGVKNFENTYQGLDAKIKKTTKQLDDYNKKLKLQETKQKEVGDALEKSKKKLDEMEGSVDKTSKQWKDQVNLVQKNAQAYLKISTDIDTTKSNISKLSSELNESKSKFEELGKKTQTLDEKLDDISRSADLSQSEFNKLGAELNENGTYFQKLGNDMDRLSSEINSGLSKINAYETEINKLSTTLDKNKDGHSKLAQEINKNEKELTQAKSEYGENSTEANQLHQKLLQLKDSYNTLETEINKNENELKEYKTSLNNTQAEVKQLSNELLKMPFNKISSDVINAGNNIKSVGQSMTTGVTLPVTAAGAAATKAGTDFTGAMSKLQATAGIADKTSVSYINLEKKAKEMGSSTSFSASEAAEGLTYLALAGWDVETQVARIEPILRAAEAGGMDLARCSDLVTDSMSSASVASGDFAKYLDITAQAQRKSNTSMEQMLEAYTIAGGMFSSLNIPLEESGALLGVLANRGTKGSEAGNALISVFSNLITETGQAGKALDAMGISLYDSTGKQRSMVEVLKEMAQKLGVTADGTSNLTDQQKQQYAAMVGGKTQFDTLMKLLAGVSSEYDDLHGQLVNSNGALMEMASIMKDNLGGKIESMKSAIEGALIEAFNALEPVLERVVKCITDAANWFSNLDDEAQQNIITIAGVVAALGPMLMAFGQLMVVGGNAITVFGKLSKSTNDTYKSVGLLKKAFTLLGGPTGIGATILAITLACKAFSEINEVMQQDTIKSIDDVINGMNGLSDKTKETITPFLELGQTVETEFMKMNTSGVIMTSEMKSSVIKNLDEMTKGVSESITKSKEDAVKGLEEMFKSTVSITDEEKAKIIETTKVAYDTKIETVKESKAKISEILNNALSENRELNIEEENQIRTHYKNIKDISLESMVATKEELLTIKKELNINSKELSAQQASDVIKEATKQRDESIKAAQDEYEKRLDYAATLRSQGGAENEALAQKVISEATRMKDEQITQANLAADGVISAARTQAGEYVKNIDYMTGEVRNGWEQLGFDLDSAFYNIYYSLVESFQNMGAHTQVFFNEMKSSLLQFVLDSIDWWRQLPFTDDNAFEGIYENCKKSLDSTKDYIASKNKEIEEMGIFQNLPGRVKEQLSRLSPVLEEHFKVPMEKLLFDTQIWSNMTTEEFYKLPPNVQDALRKIDQSLVEAGQGSLESFLQRTKMTNEGVIFSFDQLDSDVRNSMTNLNNSILDLNGINLDQFVMQCVSAADGGKSAFESLPGGVQASIEGLNSILVDRHNMTLEQFILNTKRVTGEYKDVVNVNTKEAAQQADNNTKQEKDKVVNNKENEKKEVLDKEKQKTTAKDTEQKKQVNNAEKNAKDEKQKSENAKKQESKTIIDTEKNKTSNLNTEGQKQASDASKNAKKAGDDSKKAYKDSSIEVQKSATDMYNGSKKSYSKMSDVAREEGTRMYKGVTTSAKKMSDNTKQSATDMYKGVSTSAKKMADNAKTAASSMYNGVTNSTRKMADKAIADWNRIRTAYSRSISGTVTKTTINKIVTQNEGPKVRGKRSIPTDNISKLNDIGATYKLRTPNISDYAISSRNYSPNSSESVSIANNRQNTFNNNIDNKKTNELLNEVISLLKNDNSDSGDLIVRIDLGDKEITRHISSNMARNVRRRM